MDRIWDILQIKEGADKKAIKKAYARLSKEIHPEEKPEEFRGLYEAYRRALQYSSYMRESEKSETEVMPGTDHAAESTPYVKKQDRYKELGLYAEDVQLKKFRLTRIKYFRDSWDEEIHGWEQTGVFLTESWKAYLQSEEFREVKWSPMVMEVIAEAVLRYYEEEEILLFFRELYDFETSVTERESERRQLTYRGLHPAYMKKERRQEAQEEWLRAEKIRFFQICWREQMTVWENGGLFLSEDWKTYLESSEFWEIMWRPVVMGTIAEGVAWCYEEKPELSAKDRFDCERNQKILLFFWDLYDFEKLGKESCKGESLQLYKKLYPAYIYRVSRETSEENKKELLKEQCWQMGKYMLIWLGASLLVAFVFMTITWEIMFLIIITVVLAWVAAYGNGRK